MVVLMCGRRFSCYRDEALGPVDVICTHFKRFYQSCKIMIPNILNGVESKQADMIFTRCSSIMQIDVDEIHRYTESILVFIKTDVVNEII